MKKAFFLDRDGVICRQVKDLTVLEQFELIEGVGEAVRKINNAGYLAIVITNQPIVAKGFLTEETLKEIHEKMKRLIAEKGGKIDAVYYCPHHPEKGFEGERKELKFNCECRKPKPGMLLRAAEEHGIDLRKSWMIGDTEKDMQAGKAAGVKTMLVDDRKGLLEAVESIIK